MLTHISATNFKSWKTTGKVKASKITGLFGGNSSGKTSILQLLLMLKQTAESSDRSQVIHLGDLGSHVELGTFRDVVFNHEKANSLTWNIAWELPKSLSIEDPANKKNKLFQGDSIQFSATIEENGNRRVLVRDMCYIFNEQTFSMIRKDGSKDEYELSHNSNNNSSFKFIRTPGRPWALPSPTKCYGFPDQVKAYYQNASFLSDLELSLEDFFANTFYLGPLRDYPKRQYTWAGAQPADMGRRGEKVVDALLASRDRTKIGRGKGKKTKLSVEEYVAHWLKELKLIHSFSVEPIKEGSNLYQVWVQKTEKSAKVLITDVGFGVSQILPVLTLCYYVPEGSTILMEQPEIHLHPSVQAGLADVFIDAIKVRKVQIILESHSEHLLKRLQRRIAEEGIDRNDTSLYFCEAKSGESCLKPLELDVFGNIINWPEHFFGDDFGEIAETAKAIQRRRQKETIP